MKVFILIGVCVSMALAAEQEVFRYDDPEQKSFHFMNGEPGVDVNGGFGFAAPDGETFELMYRANELGFQPEADYLPQPVTETQEVIEARAAFRLAYDNFKAMVKKVMQEVEAANAKVQAEDVDDAVVVARKKRQAVLPYYSYTPLTSYYPAVYPSIAQPQRVFLRPVVQPQQQQLIVPSSRFSIYRPQSNIVPNIPETQESGVIAE